MRYSFFFSLLLLVLTACHRTHEPAELEAAIQRYNHLLQTMDADSMSRLFTPDGNLGDMARGRDSIRKFLASFTNVKVLSSTLTTDSILLKGDSATQTGTYQQSDIIDGKDTVHAKGSYTAKWQWNEPEGWLLSSMRTRSAP
jgi:hypothetical protein